MAKYTQTKSDIFKACIVIASYFYGLWLVAGAGVGVYINYTTDGDRGLVLFIAVVSAIIASLLFFFLYTLQLYLVFNRLYKDDTHTAEVIIGKDALNLKAAGISIDVPYATIKKASMRNGFVLARLAGGGSIFAIPLDKLSMAEQKKLLAKLGLKNG